MNTTLILMPAYSFFRRGKHFSGLIALVFQFSIIGWIPSIIWAVSAEKKDVYYKRVNQYYY